MEPAEMEGRDDTRAKRDEASASAGSVANAIVVGARPGRSPLAVSADTCTWAAAIERRTASLAAYRLIVVIPPYDESDAKRNTPEELAVPVAAAVDVGTTVVVLLPCWRPGEEAPTRDVQAREWTKDFLFDLTGVLIVDRSQEAAWHAVRRRDAPCWFPPGLRMRDAEEARPLKYGPLFEVGSIDGKVWAQEREPEVELRWSRQVVSVAHPSLYWRRGVGRVEVLPLCWPRVVPALAAAITLGQTPRRLLTGPRGSEDVRHVTVHSSEPEGDDTSDASLAATTAASEPPKPPSVQPPVRTTPEAVSQSAPAAAGPSAPVEAQLIRQRARKARMERCVILALDETPPGTMTRDEARQRIVASFDIVVDLAGAFEFGPDDFVGRVSAGKLRIARRTVRSQEDGPKRRMPITRPAAVVLAKWMPFVNEELTTTELSEIVWGKDPAKSGLRHLGQLVSQLRTAFPKTLVGSRREIAGGMVYWLKPRLRIAVVRPAESEPTESLGDA